MPGVQVCGRSRQWWRKDVLSDDSDDSLSSGGDDDYVGGRITSPVRAGSPAVPTLDELDMNEVRVCVGRWYRQVSGHPGRPSRVLIRLQVGEQVGDGVCSGLGFCADASLLAIQERPGAVRGRRQAAGAERPAHIPDETR